MYLCSGYNGWGVRRHSGRRRYVLRCRPCFSKQGIFLIRLTFIKLDTIFIRPAVVKIDHILLCRWLVSFTFSVDRLGFVLGRRARAPCNAFPVVGCYRHGQCDAKHKRHGHHGHDNYLSLVPYHVGDLRAPLLPSSKAVVVSVRGQKKVKFGGIGE